jgi:hypothetical protein
LGGVDTDTGAETAAVAAHPEHFEHFTFCERVRDSGVPVSALPAEEIEGRETNLQPPRAVNPC